MRLKVSKEKVEKSFEVKVDGGKLVQGANTWAVSLLRYSAAFFNWIKCEL